MRIKIGNSFNSISTMLGGKACGNQGKDILKAVLEFAEASQRFRTRAPDRPQRRGSKKKESE
jgi:hypothetical protein